MANPFSNLMGLFTGENTEKAEADARAARAEGYKGASDVATTYAGKAQDYLTGAQQRYDPLQAATFSGVNDWNDATGVNGPEGLARARQKFMLTPGVNEGITLTNDQIQRAGAGSGLSSNILQAIADNTAKMMSQSYGTYADRLKDYISQNKSVLDSRTGIDTSSAANWNTLGYKLGDWRTGQATGDAAGYSKIGDAQNAGGMSLLNSMLGAAKIAGSIAAPYAFPAAGLANKLMPMSNAD